MIVRITDSTDGKYIGQEFDSEDMPVVLGDDAVLYFDRLIPLPDGVRFASSSYIIDTVKV